MKKNKVLSIILTLIIILSACTTQNNQPNSVNLTNNLIAENITNNTLENSEEVKSNITELSLKILNENYKEDNILISPLSIITALGMTLNGAENNTLSQAEELLGSAVSELNVFLKNYYDSMPNGDKYKFSSANSIWIKEDPSLTVEEDFLQANKNYYNPQIYTSAFDNATLSDINSWITKYTDNQIEKALDYIDPEALMYLINALSFDAEWKEIYKDFQVYTDDFTDINGNVQSTEFMRSDEYTYLSGEDYSGFMKPYYDDKYSFVAILPNENVDFTQFINDLNSDKISQMFSNKTEEKVLATLPKFTTESSLLLNDSLITLGMSDAFSSEDADFTGLGTYLGQNIYIGRIIHKTKIDVNEKGTKAGAVTIVEMTVEGAMMEEPKVVKLNRPFIYMIVDNENNFPLFLGAQSTFSTETGTPKEIDASSNNIESCAEIAPALEKILTAISDLGYETVYEIDEDSISWTGGKSSRIIFDDNEILISVFDSVDEAENFASDISQNGLPFLVDWIGLPHFFQYENLIISYFSGVIEDPKLDEDIVKALENICGSAFYENATFEIADDFNNKLGFNIYPPDNSTLTSSGIYDDKIASISFESDDNYFTLNASKTIDDVITTPDFSKFEPNMVGAEVDGLDFSHSINVMTYLDGKGSLAEATVLQFAGEEMERIYLSLLTQTEISEEEMLSVISEICTKITG